MEQQLFEEGLFEKLSGRFLDGTPVKDVPSGKQRIKSILDHLNRLFNTRRGSLVHIPDYGLPDIAEVFRHLPDGLDKLEKIIGVVLGKYEPRLERVKIKHLPVNPSSAKLTFQLYGIAGKSGKIMFTAIFYPNGQAVVNL